MATAINILDTLVGSIQTIYNRLSKKEANGADYYYDFHEDGEFGWGEGRAKGDSLLTVSYSELNSIYILFTTLKKNVKSEIIGLKKNHYMNNVSNGQFKNFKQSINSLSSPGSYTINEDGFVVENGEEGKKKRGYITRNKRIIASIIINIIINKSLT